MSPDRLWLWLQASDTWILSVTIKFVLWGLHAGSGHLPPSSLLGEEVEQGAPWCSSSFLSLSCFIWSLSLSYPVSLSLFSKEAGKLETQGLKEHILYTLWSQ